MLTQFDLTELHKKLCVLLLAPALALVVVTAAVGQSISQPISQPIRQSIESRDTIGLDEIERGMRGYGLSVFSGSKARRFEVEVVGKLENLNPGLSFIMANLQGENLEETGVIAGMSGSPVYLDGRLAGAVAFSWNFSRGALAGITPIAAMRELTALPVVATSTPQPSPRTAPFPLRTDEQLERLLEGDFGALLMRGGSRESLQQWMARTSGLGRSATGGLSAASGLAGVGTASALQLLTVGFGQQTRSLLGAGLPGGWQNATGESAGRTDSRSRLPPLAGGSPVAALLVGGDLLMAVNGTITERRGDEILAFGHPYLGMGPVSLPMAKAEVVAVVSSRLSSFKISNVGAVVGAFDEDRLAGMRGRVGAVAATTPLSVVVRHPQEGERRFEMEVADLQAMRPMLMAATTLQCINSATRTAGDGGLDLRARFEIAGEQDLEIVQSFDGPSSAIDAAIYLLQVTAFVELNPLVDADVERVTVDIDQYDSIRTANLLEAYADRRALQAGEPVELRLRLRDYRGAVRTETLSVRLDQDLEPGKYYLFVGDGVSVDAARERIEPRRNRSFSESLERLRSLHSAKQLVILGVDADRGVISGGGALPALPGSLREIWQSSSAGQVKGTSLAVVSERVVERDRPLSGVSRVDLEILPPRSR